MTEQEEKEIRERCAAYDAERAKHGRALGPAAEDRSALLAALDAARAERDTIKLCGEQNVRTAKLEHEGDRKQWQKAALAERERAEKLRAENAALREALHKAVLEARRALGEP